MPIEFEFALDKGFHFAEAFATRFGGEVAHNRAILPQTLGEGFIQEIFLSNGLFLCVHHYWLNEELVLRRAPTSSPNMLTLKFDCRRMPVEQAALPHQPLFTGSNGCEVELGTGNFFTELVIPAKQHINFLVVGASRQTILGILDLQEEGCSIESLLKESPSFVLHEVMTQEMERVLKQLSAIDQTATLATLFYKNKTEELIYLLFSKLMQRAETASITVDQADAEKIYKLRAAMLADLSLAPELSELSGRIGISLTKMKQLFRQIFGDSIYNYYQSARMNEAARLLAIQSVSETGYQLGFTNLSHFGRLFEKHFQIKPKKYKDSLT
ncbi:helix-turn-helix transcriptional regulator [Mucilaginibacter flavus]|uniref:helix-turn-helix transcriptional regulator n=1 Tax=Mucilaginibacter flavus TaxID=931504 RepID=UPI0025B5C574|nr:AraC family transcriptional regulator [Mucilaginibacter flavus]MDN3581582.1 AraC family transcriptional regulator [Mucilaginibacter flavus]